MDYKQKYEEALEIARCYKGLRAEMEMIFPELKEKSKNEMMINFITHELACIRATDEKDSDRYNELTEAITWLEKQNEHQQFLNKIQVGDELTKNERGQLVNLSQLERVSKPRNKQKTEESCHLWTIQDAKEGDVLVTRLSPEGDWIGMYKQSTGDTFKTHCYLSAVGEFVINPNRCKNHGTYGLHPATKEQCDLLFQKIKEAGYEWDGEKKELKKIEYKPVKWSEEDEYRVKDTIYFLDTAKKHYASVIELYACIDWLKSLKQRMKGQ